MTGNEAEDLAIRLFQTYPKGPPADVWELALADLDAGAAGTAFIRLLRAWSVDEHHGRSPGVADLMQIYRTLNVHDASTRPKIADCADCQNTGTAPITGTVQCADGTHIIIDVAVGPCRCPRGRNTEDLLRGIGDGNEAELNRLFPNRHQDQRNPAA